jgi:phospholipid/cholesterol/gamma-HCH transport system ATP-binding protein
VADRLQKVVENPDPWIQEYFLGPRGRAASYAAQTNPTSQSSSSQQESS